MAGRSHEGGIGRVVGWSARACGLGLTGVVEAQCGGGQAASDRRRAVAWASAAPTTETTQSGWPTIWS